jgi:hypothetical protein
MIEESPAPTADLGYKLEIEPLDLGAGAKGVGFELIERSTREPVRGPDAGRIWAASLAAIAAGEPFALDFFAHIERVRDYCERRAIEFRQAAARSLVVPAPAAEVLAGLVERFAAETFGARAGGSLPAEDAAIEGALSSSGVDAYAGVIDSYLFCAVCDFENGFLTLLTNRLSSAEVIRRLQPALKKLSLNVDIVRAEPA